MQKVNLKKISKMTIKQILELIAIAKDHGTYNEHRVTSREPGKKTVFITSLQSWQQQIEDVANTNYRV